MDARDSLQLQINRLLLATNRLRREYPDPGDFISEFAGMADQIIDAAAPEDYDWAVTGIEAILKFHGARAPH